MSRHLVSAEGSVDNTDDLDALFAQLEAELTEAAPAEPAAPAATEDDLLDLFSDRPELRDAPRLSPEEVAREVRVTVRGAAEAKAINVSETGCLAETTSRLRPGTVVELILTFDGVRVIETDLERIAARRSEYSELFELGQVVLTELRSISDKGE